MRLADQLRAHFGHRDHLYGVLLADLADDLEAGGPTAEILRDHLDAAVPDVVQLRLLAGLFRIVLRGEAPQLEPFYPVLGGTADPADAWPPVRDVLAAHVAELRAALDLAPQTNEPGRSAALAVGLFEAVRRHGLHRVRLLEPGASAGLNLLVDRYRVVGPGWSWGPPDSPLVLDTEAAGVHPEQIDVVERRGCDLAPVDPVGAATYLTSFVWPFDLDRHARLAAALRVARDHPVRVDRAPAAAWTEERLADPVEDGVLTVVWHSITAQYWPAEEWAALDEAIAQASRRIPLARVTLEFEAADAPLPRVLVDGDPVATAHFHGTPVPLKVSSASDQ